MQISGVDAEMIRETWWSFWRWGKYTLLIPWTRAVVVWQLQVWTMSRVWWTGAAIRKPLLCGAASMSE
jgi:hypothetical protein